MSASIVLSPEKGVSAVTIQGSNFKPNSVITVYWDGKRVPTVPIQVLTDGAGTFACIISVYDQSAPGTHEIKAVDPSGNSALATFTVIDVKGPQGEPGPSGASATLSPGYLGGLLLLAVAVGAVTGSIIGRTRRQSKGETQN